MNELIFYGYRKRWEIYKVEVNKVTGQENLTTIQTPIKELAPDSFNEAQLVILPRMLMYGVYKLIFYSRMWDTNDADPLFTRSLPFIKVAISQIKTKEAGINKTDIDNVMFH